MLFVRFWKGGLLAELQARKREKDTNWTNGTPWGNIFMDTAPAPKGYTFFHKHDYLGKKSSPLKKGYHL